MPSSASLASMGAVRDAWGRSSTPTEPARVVVGHREQLTRCALRALIDGDDGLEVVAEAASARAGADLARVHAADLLVLDSADLGGGEPSSAALVVVTSRVDRHHVMSALRAGARGYVTTDMTGEALVDALRHVAAGRRYVSAAISVGMLGDFIATQTDAAADASGPTLSAREVEVLCLVADGQGNREIADTLHISIHTVDSHRRNIMAKLGLRSVVDLVRFALREGLVSLEA